MFSIGTPCKQVSKLRIGKFVNASGGIHGKVAPYTGGGSEIQFLNATRSGFEAGFGIFGRNPDGNAMSIGFLTGGIGKINVFRYGRIGWFVAIFTVQFSNFGNVTEGQSHGHLQLCRRQIHAGNHFRHGMFHLQAWIQFQKVKFVIRFGIQIFHRPGIGIMHRLGQGHGGLFHVTPDGRNGRHGRTFFNDFLMSSLHTAITTIQGNGIPIFIGQQLDF
mmetsp:Transcript_19721/g.41067  ORF Transcript_19721/g.41067 Transcript_19721/m.41067 type:complete len:218 (-) Transcript_19721:1008-1661(-)